MATFLAQVSFPYDSGLPKDVSVNTFHFDEVPASSPDPADLVTALDNFYTATYSGESGALMSYFSSTLGDTATVKVYNLDDAIPRTPVLVDTFSFTPNTGTGGLPEEMALCLSYQAAPTSGELQRRRRGRIYFGPLSLLAIEGAAASDTTWPMPPRPASDLISRANKSMLNLVGEALAADWLWVVRSTVGSGDTTLITEGWVDNAFDIQRRRGPAATTRTTW